MKYRGYGGSSGEPSEAAIYSDARHIFERLNEKHSQISLIGRSLGSAVATHLAVNNQINGLILVTPFDSIQSIAQKEFPLYPMELLLTDKHDSASRAPKINTATLVIAAGSDRIIDMSHTKNLVNAFTSDINFHVIDEAGHNNISYYPEYNQVIKAFLNNVDTY